MDCGYEMALMSALLIHIALAFVKTDSTAESVFFVWIATV